MKYSHDVIFRESEPSSHHFHTKKESDKAITRIMGSNFLGCIESITVYPTNKPWQQITYRFKKDGSLLPY